MDNFKLVRRKGTLINVGNASGAVEPIAPLKLVAKNLKLVRPRQVPCSLSSQSIQMALEVWRTTLSRHKNRIVTPKNYFDFWPTMS